MLVWLCRNTDNHQTYSLRFKLHLTLSAFYKFYEFFCETLWRWRWREGWGWGWTTISKYLTDTEETTERREKGKHKYELQPSLTLKGRLTMQPLWQNNVHITFKLLTMNDKLWHVRLKTSKQPLCNMNQYIVSLLN